MISEFLFSKRDETNRTLWYRRGFTQLKQEFSYIFADKKYPGVPSVNLNTIQKDTTFTIGDTEIEPIQVWHYKLPVMGFKINNFAYITDANKIDEDQRKNLKTSMF